MKRILFLAAMAASACVIAQKKTTTDLDKQIQSFDAYVENGRNQWNVPGLAVAVVKDGKVIFKKGYGVRELGKTDPVTTETQFACASTTKAMTAVCMGMLVDEGKVKWDDAVIKYLPEYQLYDPFVTRELRIRDLFIHNSGVGNADFVWSMMDIPVEEILRKMRDVKPSYSMRSSFIYQNIFYIAAGEVIRKITGKPWETFIQERIFTPLGMTRTVPMMRYIKGTDYTKPHDRVESIIQPIGHTKDDAVGPAGAAWASIDDMGKWMACMLDSSKYAGGRLLTAKTWVEMFKPQTLVPASEFYPTMQIIKPNWTTYGLGWFQHDYKGKKINYHTGSLAGLVAIHAQLPDERLGIYVFGNLDHAEVRHALVYKAFDHFALGGSRDWSTEFKELYDKLRDKGEKEEKAFEAKRVANTKPSLDLAAYTGKYKDPLYGETEVSVNGNQLIININNYLTAKLDHWHYDTFRGWFDKKWYGKGNATFSIGADGKIKSINMDGIEMKRVN
ncbi:MAG: serine hydrolase [Cyclobacteriaceae bacterium]|nr:serine hydrolase [Cyclobacteriaceae bacterium]